MSAKPINIADAIVAGVESVTKTWTKQRKAEERVQRARWRRADRMVHYERVTVRSAAFAVMEDAYMKASDNGRLPARPRQVMYAARPQILALIGGRTLDTAISRRRFCPTS